MHYLSLALATLLAIPSPVLAGKGATPAQDIEALVKRHAELELFSGTVLVADKGKTVYAGAFGEANKDHRIPNRLDTSYNIGSIGKTFTAVAIMRCSIAFAPVRLRERIFPLPLIIFFSDSVSL